MNDEADRDDEAVRILEEAVSSGQVSGAVLYLRRGERVVSHAFGAAPSPETPFLLGSITKPLVVAALMTLYDKQTFGLDDPLALYLPELVGEGREAITIRHLLTHTGGLPDQLDHNAALRQSHAPLPQFVEETLKLAPHFPPGTRYEYSSMGILLLAELAQRLSGREIRAFVAEAVFTPLGMTHSALGLGSLDFVLPVQVEHAAPEAGGGAAGTETWDWNSPYWRNLGAPWGGAHASAADVAHFLEAFAALPRGFLSPETAELMTQNHNPDGLKPRGLGFDLTGESSGIFGHLGSTGTLAWHDPVHARTCVALTTLPLRATTPHPVERVWQEFSGTGANERV